MTPFDIDAWGAKLAGLGGAALSMRFIKGTWYERLTMAVGGVIASYFLAEWLSVWTRLPLQVTGFLLGLFGMAIASRIWEAIQNAPLGELWSAAIDRIRGRGASPK